MVMSKKPILIPDPSYFEIDEDTVCFGRTIVERKGIIEVETDYGVYSFVYMNKWERKELLEMKEFWDNKKETGR